MRFKLLELELYFFGWRYWRETVFGITLLNFDWCDNEYALFTVYYGVGRWYFDFLFLRQPILYLKDRYEQSEN